MVTFLIFFVLFLFFLLFLFGTALQRATNDIDRAVAQRALHDEHLDTVVERNLKLNERNKLLLAENLQLRSNITERV